MHPTMRAGAPTASSHLLLLLLLLAGAAQLAVMPAPAGAMTCGEVAVNLAPCFYYLLGYENDPPALCCNGVRTLDALASTAWERRAACGCLKQAAASFRDLKDENLAALPRKCSATTSTLPFPAAKVHELCERSP